ncbi:hypothetical protein NIES4106_51160 [Fischerella sp. NIES-4106]|jgi:hypothetical protein|nr:hypothetical protein NIES4106_51160 [Fischerella sp. NIES-4106]
MMSLPKGREISPPWGVTPPHTKTTVVVILEQIFSTDRSFCNFPDQYLGLGRLI